MSKFYYLENNYIPIDVPIIVDEIIGKTKQFNEILDCLNENNREILYAKRGSRYNVGNLYFLPTLNFVPPEYGDLRKIKYEDCVFNFGSLSFLKNKFIGRCSEKKFGKKIFISRKNASAKRRYNESEVVKLFLQHDFEICYPETLSFSEQISLFRGAEFIAGATGAAFTNLIFCREGCKALCLISQAIDLSIFSTIAKISGVDLQYHVTNDEDFITNDLHANFVIDIEKLEKNLVDFMTEDPSLVERSKFVQESEPYERFRTQFPQDRNDNSFP